LARTSAARRAGALSRPLFAQVYGRRSDLGPPHAVGVAHFTQSADEVAAYLFDPAHMGDWDAELCEKGQARFYANIPPGARFVSRPGATRANTTWHPAPN
jgi:hypothetical protein